MRYIPLLALAGLLAEIASLVLVGQAIGVAPVLLLVVAGVTAGGVMIRNGGISLAASFHRWPNDARRAPAGRGAFTIFAGILLILPGFVSDACAIGLLMPAVQRWIVGWLSSAASREQTAGELVIDGEVVEIQERQDPRSLDR
jgi:UPF0716 protein FxsA